MKDKIILWSPEPPKSDSNPEPEEKVCPKCLELESECECQHFDELEKEELEQIRIDRTINSIY